MTNTDRSAPRDAKIIEEILKSMGVQDWEPRVVNQLMEFMYRYNAEILQEAQAFGEHAGRAQVNISDVKLAVKGYLTNYFTGPPPRDVTQRIAQVCNSIPLKNITGPPGLRLPPEEHTLTKPGWQVRLPSKKSESEPTAMELDLNVPTPSAPSSTPPSDEARAFQAFALKAKK